METLFGTIAVLFVSAMIIDRYLKSEVISSLRSELHGITKRIANGKIDEVIFSAHLLFCRVFDAVYGSKTWSRGRFLRSCCLSLVFIGFSIFLIGVSNTILGMQHAFGSETMVIILNLTIFGILSTINLIADFISLQETRWILRLVRGRSLRKLAIFVWVDLTLTTAIYVIVLGIPILLIFLSSTMYSGDSAIDRSKIISGMVALLFSPEGALPFFLSTFGTSIVLFGFVLTAVGIRLLSYSKVLTLAMEYVAKDAKPAQMAAGVLSVVLCFIFALGQLVLWVTPG